MKKIIATILSLIIAISVCNISVFAVSDNNDELNPEEYTKIVPKKRISKETQDNIKKEFETIQKENPQLTKKAIYKIISEKFDVSRSSIERYNSDDNYREYYRQYYKRNKLKQNERDKKYREEKKEQLKEHYRQYREKNREKIKEGQRQYREKNREKIRNYKREYYKKNKKLPK